MEYATPSVRAAFAPNCASGMGTLTGTPLSVGTVSECSGPRGSHCYGSVVLEPHSDNMATWPPGLSSPPEVPGAPPITFDPTPYTSPTDRFHRFLTRLDVCRVSSAFPVSAAVGSSAAVACKAVLLGAVGVAHAVVLAPAIAPTAIAVGAVAGVATAARMAAGPVKRLIRGQLRQWFSEMGTGIVPGTHTDPGFAPRDAADDEGPDLPSTVTVAVAGGSKKARVKRVRHFAPYAGGKVRGAYLCSLVAEVRTLFAGRARDDATEHAARRALVTRMKEHGMRYTDIDRVREHCVNAVFFVSEDEEVAAHVRKVGERWGLQRGAGGPN